MTTKQQLDDFYDFACEHVNGEESGFTLDELFFIWRAQHPTDNELNESIAAVNEALSEYAAGERGVPAREHHRETCHKLGLVIDG